MKRILNSKILDEDGNITYRMSRCVDANLIISCDFKVTKIEYATGDRRGIAAELYRIRSLLRYFLTSTFKFPKKVTTVTSGRISGMTENKSNVPKSGEGQHTWNMLH